MVIVKCPVCGSKEVRKCVDSEGFECDTCGCQFDKTFADFEEE
jgi:transcription initiation factor TFIIIB Brf1 subunit/transcription initiation factor TFIIB